MASCGWTCFSVQMLVLAGCNCRERHSPTVTTAEDTGCWFTDTKELKEWRMELSESDSQVSGEVTFKDVVTKSSGDALAAGSEVPPCTGAKETICCAASATKDTCRCGVR